MFAGQMLANARTEEGVRQEESLRAARRGHRKCRGGCGCRHVIELDWAKLFSVPNPREAVPA
jgi:hypothetical protein